MIKCDKGKVEMDGTGSELIIEMALIINAFNDVFDDMGDRAMEAATTMSKKAVVQMFERKDMADA